MVDIVFPDTPPGDLRFRKVLEIAAGRQLPADWREAERLNYTPGEWAEICRLAGLDPDEACQWS